MMQIIRPIPIDSSAQVAPTLLDTAAPYSATANYAAGAVVQHPSGQAWPLSTLRYKCLFDGTVGVPPIDPATGVVNADKWVPSGPLNECACFDSMSDTKTVGTGSLWLALPSREATGIGLFGVTCDSVIVTVYPTVARDTAPVYNLALTPPPGETVDVVLNDLPPTTGGSILVRLQGAAPTTTVSLGTVIYGVAHDLGKTQAGPKIGATDFSRKTLNPETGTYSLLKRKYARKLSLQTEVRRAELSNTYALLADARATPSIWIADEGGHFAVLRVLGLCADFSADVQYANSSIVSIEIDSIADWSTRVLSQPPLRKLGPMATPIRFGSGTRFTETKGILVTDAVTKIASAAGDRIGLRILNLSESNFVAIGSARINWVKSAMRLPPGVPWNEDEAPAINWYAVCAPGTTAHVSIMEVFE